MGSAAPGSTPASTTWVSNNSGSLRGRLGKVDARSGSWAPFAATARPRDRGGRATPAALGPAACALLQRRTPARGPRRGRARLARCRRAGLRTSHRAFSRWWAPSSVLKGYLNRRDGVFATTRCAWFCAGTRFGDLRAPRRAHTYLHGPSPERSEMSALDRTSEDPTDPPGSSSDLNRRVPA